jgi:ubiquinone/menaquinone biosynthesis C-methylase UbiE
MLQEYFQDSLDASQAKKEAQKLTFYPMMFQASRVMRSLGILQEVYENRRKGITPEEIANKLKLPYYGVNLLLETGLTIGLVHLKEENIYTLSNMGYFLLIDKATIVNLNFSHDVCYKSMYHLEESIKEEFPSGLKEIGMGDATTIYPGLSKLKEPIKSSWFDFDHYYSDKAFPAAMKIVFEDSPKHVVDIGGNTGRWSIECCKFDENVSMLIVDLPGQLEKAMKNIREMNFQHRISGIARDVLSDNFNLPDDVDVIWMSQFLDCFSEDQILLILSNIRNTIKENTSVYILELFWDRQKDIEAAYCLQGTSLYFTAVANGNSKMYHSRDLYELIKRAGMEVVTDIDNIGEFHTLLKCKKTN